MRTTTALIVIVLACPCAAEPLFPPTAHGTNAWSITAAAGLDPILVLSPLGLGARVVWDHAIGSTSTVGVDLSGGLDPLSSLDCTAPSTTDLAHGFAVGARGSLHLRDAKDSVQLGLAARLGGLMSVSCARIVAPSAGLQMGSLFLLGSLAPYVNVGVTTVWVAGRESLFALPFGEVGIVVDPAADRRFSFGLTGSPRGLALSISLTGMPADGA